MHIPFAEIPEEGMFLFDIQDVSWFPDHEVSHSGPVTASIFLQRKIERVLAKGSISAILLFECDRCLVSFEMPTTQDFKIDVELTGSVVLGREHICGQSEMDTMFVDEPVVDVHAVLRQQALLSLPGKRLCKENCLGLCSHCGADLNQGSCDCAEKQTTSPFGVLKDFVKDR